ncbi:MAG TPA: glycosyltransferase [Candidatus Limnocylindrales bacterium]|nr:glycosyltransferase [Candidatus Limnocylindrales bacterium]
MTPETAGRRRAVVLVGGPAAPYSRGLRIARALDSGGYDVEIAAITAEGIPDEERDGPITIRRYRPTGRHARAELPVSRDHSGEPPPMPVRVVRHQLRRLQRWILWPYPVRGWWATLAAQLAPADIYHACGSLAIAPAIAARERDRRAGRVSHVVYDAVDDVGSGNNVLRFPRAVRALIRRRERSWARAADARITVNDTLAERLASAWATPPPLTVPNWPEGPPRPGTHANPIREALRLPAGCRIVLFQGRLGPHRGLDEAAEAVLQVPNAVLVLLGFGSGYAASAARDADPIYAGRHFTLPAVHPDELLAWTAAADVALVTLPPVSANQRASTPNKFWEAIAAGTPIVLGPDLPVMAELVRAFDLGEIAERLTPESVAIAIRQLVDVPREVADARRRRIAAVGAERFSWPAAAERYLAMVYDLTSASG